MTKGSKTIFCYFLILIIFLTGCADKQTTGKVVGGLGGALVGSQFGRGGGKLLGIGVGAVVGSLVGNAIGKELDAKDKAMLEKSSYQALEAVPSGQAVEWRNPDSGHYGKVIPTNTYQAKSGRYCREYTQVVVIGGEQQKSYGTACRQPDGQWEIVK